MAQPNSPPPEGTITVWWQDSETETEYAADICVSWEWDGQDWVLFDGPLTADWDPLEIRIHPDGGPLIRVQYPRAVGRWRQEWDVCVDHCLRSDAWIWKP